MQMPSNLLIIDSSPVLSKAPCLPTAVGQRDRCVKTDSSTCNDMAVMAGLVMCCRSVVTHLLECVLCAWWDVLGCPRSNTGRLVGPENEYMAGRKPTSLLAGAEWCIVVQPTTTNAYELKDQFWYLLDRLAIFCDSTLYDAHVINISTVSQWQLPLALISLQITVIMASTELN